MFSSTRMVKIVAAGVLVACTQNADAGAGTLVKFLGEHVLGKLLDGATDLATGKPDVWKLQLEIHRLNADQDDQNQLNFALIESLRRLSRKIAESSGLSKSDIQQLIQDEMKEFAARVSKLERDVEENREKHDKLREDLDQLETWLKNELCQRMGRLESSHQELRSDVTSLTRFIDVDRDLSRIERRQLEERIQDSSARITLLEESIDRLIRLKSCPSLDQVQPHFANRPSVRGQSPLEPIPAEPFRTRERSYRIRMIPDVMNGGYTPSIETGHPSIFPFFGPIWPQQSFSPWPSTYYRY